jgi:hypothetical protein
MVSDRIVSMGFVAEYLRHLSQETIDMMLANVHRNEPVFRNILVALADNAQEAKFFSAATIDDIFDIYVRIEGHVTRVSDYRLGPGASSFGAPLSENEAVIFIQTPGPSSEKKYQVLPDNNVRFVEDVCTMMH